LAPPQLACSPAAHDGQALRDSREADIAKRRHLTTKME
jgi:hypothetical protein